MKIKVLRQDDLTVGFTLGVICKDCNTQLTERELETKVCPNCQGELPQVGRMYFLASFMYAMIIGSIFLIGALLGIVVMLPMMFLV